MGRIKARLAHNIPVGLSANDFFMYLGLTEKEAKMMRLSSLEGVAYQDIANEFALPLSNVTFTMYRSFHKLRETQDLPKEAVFKSSQVAQMWWAYKHKNGEQDLLELKKNLAQLEDQNKVLKEVNEKLKGKINELKTTFFQTKGI